MRSTGAIRGLYVIADTSVISGDLVDAVTKVIEGGACVVQYRDKSEKQMRRLREATALRQLCQQHGVTFIINDDVELALETGADGVHLGKDDAAIEFAQRQLGKKSIIGISCYNDLERGREAIAAGAGYIALGSFYPSTVKPDAVRANETLLTEAKQEFTVPVVAIGGITPEMVPDWLRPVPMRWPSLAEYLVQPIYAVRQKVTPRCLTIHFTPKDPIYEQVFRPLQTGQPAHSWRRQFTGEGIQGSGGRPGIFYPW